MADTNLGLLTTGLIKQTVAAGEATLSTAAPGVDYRPIPIQSTSITPAVGVAGADVWVMKTIVSAASGVFGVPTGTPVDGQVINYILLDDGNGPWALDMDTASCFQAIGVILPITTVDAKITAISARWHTGRGKWLVFGVSQEA
jgi:hypothetical protein